MDSLFPIEDPIDLLPNDGVAKYFGKVYSQIDSDSFLERLLTEIDWKNDQAMIFGKLITTKRKVAWYADRPVTYSYSGIVRDSLTWNELLLDLKSKAEETTGEKFNSCLLNLYHDGSEGMAWHSDAEKELVKHGTIATFSFGAERKFAFKHKFTGEKREIILESGSLLTMERETQDFWLHRLPPTTKVLTPRVNLTFRQMKNLLL